jgi:hypothetical protein
LLKSWGSNLPALTLPTSTGIGGSTPPSTQH